MKNAKAKDDKIAELNKTVESLTKTVKEKESNINLISQTNTQTNDQINELTNKIIKLEAELQRLKEKEDEKDN